MKKKLMKLLMALSVACMVGLAGCGQTDAEEGNFTAPTEVEEAQVQQDDNSADEQSTGVEVSSDFDVFTVDLLAGQLLSGKHHVDIVVKDYGTISVELDADMAPISATNFIYLANKGFYDGLTFHRIISGFMIQGGDPLGNGTGGAEYNIRGEFATNGVNNTISHERGVISMARSQMNDSASSQFFIMHQDSTYLDGQYAAFGHVTSGIEIVDAICADTPVEDNNGTVAPANQPTIETITVID